MRVSNALADWRVLLEFVNNIVIGGLSATVTTSLSFLLEQIDLESIRSGGKLPMLELKLELDSEQGVDVLPRLGGS